MRRIGCSGKEIFVYKIRTMHPYSEYLQKFVFENFGSSSGDKINSDFRITYWGKFLRKFWIDEIPMLFNLIKRDIKLVGVRPLSFHKFSTYPNYMQDFRNKSKPGLIPPFYADLPKNFEELLKSEEVYISSYLDKPLRTDINYFFKALYNIFFRNARSA